MNDRYKTVFNRSLGIWQVASELAKSQGKSGKAAAQAVLCAAGLALALASGQAHAQSIDGGATVTVSDDDGSSPWNIGGDLYVGNASTGTLAIENGGKVSNTWGYVGVDSGSTGTVTVTGAGSTWTNSQEFYVGFAGNGTLTIANRGTVSNTVGNVGRDPGSTGTVTVTGAGSTWTNSGILNVGFSGNGTLTIEDGGTVRAQRVYLGTFAPGSGTLNLNGTASNRGVLETGLVQNIHGTVVFDGGILRATGTQPNFLQNLGIGSINVNAGGAFFDTQAFDVGIATANVLTGAGGLTKLGPGKLSIAGDNSYNGDTTVSAGTLEFGAYNQTAAQTLGIGAHGSGNGEYGKLNVTGVATFASNANIEVDVAAVNTLALDQTLIGVVTAGTLNASTFNVTDNSALFNFQANLNGNAVDLAIVSASATNSGVYDAVMASRTYSATGAARVLDDMITVAPGGDMDNVITALGTLGSDREVSRAATQTLPLLSGGVTRSTLGMLSSFNQVVQSLLGSPAAGTSGSSDTGSSGSSGHSSWSNRQVWVKPFGSHAEQHDRDGASGFSARSWGIAVGAEGELNSGNTMGVAYAYADSRIEGNRDLSGTTQQADVESHLLAVYGSQSLQNSLQLDWQADVGRNGIDGKRHIDFGGLDRTAMSNYASYSAHAGAGLSKTLALNNATSFTPGIRVDYTWLRDRSYGEAGADALNLNVESHTAQALVLAAEGRISHALSDQSWVSANFGVGYDAINDRSHIVSTYAGAPGQSFTTEGLARSPWTLRGGLGYALQARQGMQISLRYDVEGRDGYVNQSASVKANWAF